MTTRCAKLSSIHTRRSYSSKFQMTAWYSSRPIEAYGQVPGNRFKKAQFLCLSGTWREQDSEHAARGDLLPYLNPVLPEAPPEPAVKRRVVDRKDVRQLLSVLRSSRQPMQRLSYTLVSDGASDRALIPILSWLLRNLCGSLPIQSARADLRRLRNPPRSLVDRIQRSVALYPCDLLFVHWLRGSSSEIKALSGPSDVGARGMHSSRSHRRRGCSSTKAH